MARVAPTRRWDCGIREPPSRRSKSAIRLRFTAFREESAATRLHRERDLYTISRWFLKTIMMCGNINYCQMRRLAAPTSRTTRYLSLVPRFLHDPFFAASMATAKLCRCNELRRSRRDSLSGGVPSRGDTGRQDRSKRWESAPLSQRLSLALGHKRKRAESTNRR